MPLEPNPYDRNLELKRLMEDLFGTAAWYDLKETRSLAIWKKYFLKALQSYIVALQENIEVLDNNWMKQMIQNNADGKIGIKQAENIDDAIGVFAATVARQSFLQMGAIPQRPKRRQHKFGLQRNLWKLNDTISVQYIQTNQQKSRSFEKATIEELGFDGFLAAQSSYRASSSKQSFQKWMETDKQKTPRSSLRGASN